MNKLKLTAGAALLTLLATAPTVAHAEKMTRSTTTVTTTENATGPKINFKEFDLNKDGLYGREEIGKKLFFIFDQDGNEVLDNTEWDEKVIATIVPVEKETYRFVDYEGDGYTELTSYSYQKFYEETGLTRFDDHKDGLSASDFIEKGFQSLDDNQNNLIELKEWERAYATNVLPAAAQQDRYN